MKRIERIGTLLVLIVLVSVVMAPAVAAPKGSGGSPPEKEETPPGLAKNTGWTVEEDKLYTTDLDCHVGIGTSDPKYKLDVLGDARISGTLHIGTSSSPGLVVTPDGDVGIGTTKPTEKLDVEGNVHASGKMLASAYSSNSPLIFETDGTERARIDDDTGNFGIGTDDPQTRLDVEVSGTPGSVGGAATIGSMSNSATGDYAIAMGCGTIATSEASTAMGKNSRAFGYAATALGYVTTAYEYGTALGVCTNASGYSSTAMGSYSEATAGSSTAMGHYTTASGTYSTAMGYHTTASKIYSTAMGHMTGANGGSSTAMGYRTYANGTASTSMGYETIAGGTASIATGYSSSADGDYSTAMGYQTTASDEYSTAMGSWITVEGANSFGIGLDGTPRTVTQSNTMAILGGKVGIGTESPTQSLSVDGNAHFTGSIYDSINQPGLSGQVLESTGTGIRWIDPPSVPDGDWAISGDDMHSIVIGNVGIGTTNPEAKLDVEATFGGAATIGHDSNSATGNSAIALGRNTKAMGHFSIAMGHSTTARASYTTAMGLYSTAYETYSTAIGYDTNSSGPFSIAIGHEAKASGHGAISMGHSTSSEGMYSTALGHETIAGGDWSTAMGSWISAEGQNSFGIGLSYNPGRWYITQPNTMAIMGGRVGIGTVTPAHELDVNGIVNATEFRDSTPVAFHAFNSAADFYTSIGWQTVEFNAEEFDYGDNYDTTTDTFTAPTAGVYQFDVTVASEDIDSGEMLAMCLVKNGIIYKYIAGEFSQNPTYRQFLSGSVTIHLNPGDEIQVKFSNQIDTSWWISGDQLNTHFSGHRVA